MWSRGDMRAPTQSLANDSPVFLPWKLFWKRRLFPTHILLFSAHVQCRIDHLKYFTHLTVIVPKITASRRRITSHQRSHSTTRCTHTGLKFKQPPLFTKHSRPFHTNTAAGAEKKRSQQVDGFRHETGFGDVHRSRRCYNIWNGANADVFLFFFNARGEAKRGRGGWNCLCENISLILPARKWVFLSGLRCPRRSTLHLRSPVHCIRSSSTLRPSFWEDKLCLQSKPYLTWRPPWNINSLASLQRGTQ